MYFCKKKGKQQNFRTSRGIGQPRKTFMKTYEVFYVARQFGYATNVESIKFSKKENADAFIALMKDEGYEITTFGGEGYTGE